MDCVFGKENVMFSSIMIFILAGLAEIGGGYLVWQWIKAGSSLVYGITGFLLLSLYGIFLRCRMRTLAVFMLLMVVFLL